jgi:Fe-S-cluster containining protein
MDYPPENPRLTVLDAARTAARTAVERLAADPGPAACEALSRELLGVVEREWDAARSTGAPIACAPGCTFCCHQRVGVLPHEAIALFRHLRTGLPPDEAAAIEQQIRANADRIEALTADEHRSANIACAFLRAGRCSAYAVRPLACATYHSLSRERCEQAYQRPRDMGTPVNSRPVLRDLKLHSEALLETVQSGLATAGLATGKGELHQRLRALLEDPDAVFRGAS